MAITPEYNKDVFYHTAMLKIDACLVNGMFSVFLSSRVVPKGSEEWIEKAQIYEGLRTALLHCCFSCPAPLDYQKGGRSGVQSSGPAIRQEAARAHFGSIVTALTVAYNKEKEKTFGDSWSHYHCR